MGHDLLPPAAGQGWRAGQLAAKPASLIKVRVVRRPGSASY